MKYRVLLLANMYPSQTEDYYDKMGFVRGGENITFIQKSIVEGLENNGCEVYILNKLLAANPRRKTVRYSEFENGKNFGYINVPFFSSNLIYYWAKKHLRQCDGYDLVIAYGLTNYHLKALRYLKKKKINCALIVPDLPENTKAKSRSILINIKNSLTNLITHRLYQKCSSSVDLFLLFSEKMKDKLLCEGKYLVTEGIASDIFGSTKPEKIIDEHSKAVFYGGGLHRKYGAKLLTDAFSKITSPDIHLILCGTGDYVEEIKKAEEKDSRIHYLGRVPRTRLLSLILGADVLVNPRLSSEVFSDYSFPSKNMEYMSSGVPFVGFKLGGIPDEYDEYINYPDDETSDSLAQKIVDVVNDESCLDKAVRAQKYVFENKNKNAVAKRIVDYFRNSH